MVRGFGRWVFGVGRSRPGLGREIMCGRRDVWIPDGEGRFFGVVVVVWVLVDCCCCCSVEKTDEAASTEPPHDTRVSSNISCVVSGNTDRSNASFTSVDSSSDVAVVAGDGGAGSDWASRGLFLEKKASIWRAAG